MSVVRESVPLDPELQARAEALLDGLDWRGVAMVEFKEDSQSGVPYVMEINGRFWGSLQLAVDAGVDFPRILVDAALGRPLHEPPAYRVGIRSRWLLGDVDHLLLRLRRSRAELDLPEGTPGRAAAVLAFLGGFFPPNRTEVFRASDPRPFAREVRTWLRDLRG